MVKHLAFVVFMVILPMGCRLRPACPVECNDGTCSSCRESRSGCCSWHGGIVDDTRTSGSTEPDTVVINVGSVDDDGTEGPEPSDTCVGLNTSEDGLDPDALELRNNCIGLHDATWCGQFPNSDWPCRAALVAFCNDYARAANRLGCVPEANQVMVCGIEHYNSLPLCMDSVARDGGPWNGEGDRCGGVEANRIRCMGF